MISLFLLRQYPFTMKGKKSCCWVQVLCIFKKGFCIEDWMFSCDIGVEGVFVSGLILYEWM